MNSIFYLLKLSLPVLVFFSLQPVAGQSYEELIDAEEGVYFFPVNEVGVFTSFEGNPDWELLFEKERVLGTEFTLPADDGGLRSLRVAYVELMEDYLVEKFNDQVFELFQGHLPARLVPAQPGNLDPNEPYYYVAPVIRTVTLLENGLILFGDYGHFIQTQLVIGATLWEHRPGREPKSIAGGSVYAFVKESTAEDIERGISSPVLKGVDRAKNKYPKKLDKAFDKIKARVDKTLPKKLKKTR